MATPNQDVGYARLLEELSLRAWPAVETLAYDGWLLRVSNGFTRRANSVHALYPSREAIHDKIRFCEALYTAKSLPTLFKICAATEPSNLDTVLETAGYRREAETSVQTVSLLTDELRSDACMNGFELALHSEPSDCWLQASADLNGVGDKNRETLREMLANLDAPVTFAAIEHEDEIVAVGMAVHEGDHVGIFDIVTASAHRNRGLGRRMVSGLLLWGKHRGAGTGYLQVMHGNDPAIRLYGNLGFETVYTYWYRVLDI